ncbi:MAG TPA: hypothetical protein VJO52_04255 [Gemmatimonadaceae bacterium]|nr:hypothetical protein [Gemmatimonadaceae bacterium]
MARLRLTARGRAALTVLAMFLMAAAALPLAAQDADTTQADDDATGTDDAERDSVAFVGRAAATVVSSYAVPDMPAAAFLGTTPAAITRPASTRDFLIGLASGVDEHGQARQGFALEASPSAIVPGFGVSLEQYRAPGVNPRYLLANLLVSFGAARAAGDSSPTVLAYGVRVTLFDRGDPMRDTAFLTALGDSIARCRPRTPIPGIPRADRPTALDPLLRDLLAERHDRGVRCMDSHTRKLARRYARAHWNASTLFLAYAGGERLRGGSFSRRRHAGDRVWATGAMRVGAFAQTLVYADWTHDRGAGAPFVFDALTYGSRFNVGSESANAFVEFLGQARSGVPLGLPATATAWSAGLELRAAEALWLSAGLGERFRTTAAPNVVAVLAGIRWGIALRPWLAPAE